jgi:hypothetical protein
MTRRRFVHRDDAAKWCQVFLEGTELTVISGRGNFRQKTTPLGTVESEVRKVLERGYVEVDEAGVPVVVAPAPKVDVARLKQRVKSDPYGVFTESKAALKVDAQTAKLLTVLLAALDAIELDVDEHDAQNYNSYFPRTDEDAPTYGALHAYRAHYERLALELKKRLMPDAAALSFHVSED